MSNATFASDSLLSHAIIFTSTYNESTVCYMLLNSSLVFLMIFGLAFFYGSLTHDKHIIDTLSKTCCIIGLISIQYVLFGFSLSFSTTSKNSFIGDLNFGALVNLHPQDYTFVLFQMSFAILTAALITGSIVGRMKFVPFLIFIFFWSTLVYCPICFWVWADSGFLKNCGSVFNVADNGGVLDFAGGYVVEVSSGVSALVCSYILGKRHKEDRIEAPVNIKLNLLGGALLWVGWFGFNGGSAFSADYIAAIATLNTQICAGASMFVWTILDLLITKKADLEGALYAGVCGLIIITPSAGFVIPGYALLMGVYGALISYGLLKLWLRFAHLAFVDDSLYVFLSHGCSGIVGIISVGLFATKSVNPMGSDGLFYGNPMQLAYQLFGLVVTITWSAVMSAIILLILKHTISIKSPYRPGINMDEMSKLGMAPFYNAAAENSVIIPKDQLKSFLGEENYSHSTAVAAKTQLAEVKEEHINKSIKHIS